MNARLHRIYVLSALMLLVAGLFQPLLAAEGLVCKRVHGAAEAHALAADAYGAHSARTTDANEAPEHRHDLPSGSPLGEAGAPASPCPAAALPATAALLTLPDSATQLLAGAELQPAHVDLTSLFRPPRLG